MRVSVEKHGWSHLRFHGTFVSTSYCHLMMRRWHSHRPTIGQRGRRGESIREKGGARVVATAGRSRYRFQYTYSTIHDYCKP